MTNELAHQDPSIQEHDIRPLIASHRPSKLPWLFAGGLVVCGLLLFSTLERRRAALVEPSVLVPREDQQASESSAPELFIPPDAASPPSPPELIRQVAPAPLVVALPAAPAGSVRRDAEQPPRSYAPPAYPIEYWSGQVPLTTNHTPAVPQAAVAPPVQPAAGDGGGAGKDRAVARRFANPATTVPRGTVIQAVLESALDSTRGGFARAIVTRDIYSFDGSKVLIQRGSRILGQYRSDVALGQRRILIQWQRLTRPDGVLIDIDSPSADPLGRAGLNGSVNTHFFERFAGAILQSTLDVGVQLAARSASRDTVVLALPGSVQQASQIAQPQQIAPTIKVRQGSGVSVFVAHDLDFTNVEK